MCALIDEEITQMLDEKKCFQNMSISVFSLIKLWSKL